MSKFDELLTKLDALGETPLKKSQPDENTEKDPEDPENGEGQDGGEENLFGKSFLVTDESGEEHEAIDGTELIKSMALQLKKQETEFAEKTESLMKSIGGFEAVAEKLVDALSTQETLLKALDEKVETIQGRGRGVKSTLTLVDKPDAVQLKKSEPEGMSPDEFMAKAMIAQKEGRIGSHQISIAETSLNNGVPVPQSIVRQVLNM